MTQDTAHTPDQATLDAPKPKRVKRSYTEEEKERGLLHLALAAGNTHLAAEQTGIPQKTLHNWARHSETDRYERITNDAVPRIHARLAAETEAAAAEALDAQRLAVQLTRTQLANGDHKDPSTAARNLATVYGINSDKANLYRGRPTTIIEHRAPQEILTSLATRIHNLTGQTINSTAEEIQDTLEPQSPVPVAQIAA